MAAIDAQQTLDGHAWPDGARLRVRMALHTGEPTATPEGYVGVDVHRAARICAAGWGSQILLSDATRALIEKDLPEDIGLRNLGEHRLKDLAHLERIFQVTAAGLPSDFPALKSLTVLPNNLPLQVTSFVGRAREMAEVRSLLGASRLLTLTGIGGCGKTRLALQVAAEVLEEFPNGVWLVELAPLSDPALVPHTVATVLQIREEPGRPILSTVMDALKEKHLLLILDNCEHLTDLLQQSADLYRVVGDKGGIAASLSALGAVVRDQGDIARAVGLFEESLAYAKEVDDRYRVGFILLHLGAAVAREDLGRAVELLEQGLAVVRELGERNMLWNGLRWLGGIAVNYGELHRAAQLFEEAEACQQEIGNPIGLAVSHIFQGSLARIQGDQNRAHARLEEAVAVLRQRANTTFLAGALDELGWLELDRGDYTRATALFEESLTLGRGMGSKPVIASAQVSLGSAALIQRDGGAPRGHGCPLATLCAARLRALPFDRAGRAR